MTITLTFTKPGTVTFEVPPDTRIAVEGRETPGQTPGAEPVQEQSKIYSAAKLLADARNDFGGLRIIRNAFEAKCSRDDIAALLAKETVNGDEFIGLLLTNGEKFSVAEAIVAGINASLGSRGQA